MALCFQCLLDPAVPLGREWSSQATSVTVKAFAVLSFCHSLPEA